MDNKISKWILLVLAVATVVFQILFFLGKFPVDWYLDYGYCLIGLGLLLAAVSAIVAIVVACMRGIPTNKLISLCVVIIALAVLFVLSFVLSKGWIDILLNFFYLTFGFSILAIIFSVIYRLVKK